VADLFSALTVVSLAALIIVAVGAVKLTEPERVERDAARDLAQLFAAKYSAARFTGVGGSPCADRPKDQCINMTFRFKLNSNQLSPEGIEQVQKACEVYKQAIDEALSQSPQRELQRDDFALQIEGHTDSTVPHEGSDRDRFLYNWILSSGRAAEVLYQFRQCDVSPQSGYRISSVGLAATEPLCTDIHPTSECLEQNRRTVMRIRVQRSARSGGH
jgi:outer membrane protein OmpA-like peptidoglycan-associated protein